MSISTPLNKHWEVVREWITASNDCTMMGQTQMRFFSASLGVCCPDTSGGSSPRGNLMQECQESVAIDWNLNSAVYKWLMFLLTCWDGGWTGHGCLNSLIAYLNVCVRTGGLWTSCLYIENGKIGTDRYISKSELRCLKIRSGFKICVHCSNKKTSSHCKIRWQTSTQSCFLLSRQLMNFTSKEFPDGDNKV